MVGEQIIMMKMVLVIGINLIDLVQSKPLKNLFIK